MNLVTVVLIVVLLAAWLRLTAAPETGAWLVAGLRRLWGLARRHTRTLLRYPELGGYVHDTSMSQWFGPGAAHYVNGTWTDVAGATANTVCKSKAAGDNTAVVTIPISLPQNGAAQKGAYLRSIDVYYIVATAALDACSALVHKLTLPAHAAAWGAATAQSFTYDAGHDAAAERITVDEHKMTLTLDTPIWLDDDDVAQVQVTFDAAATSALTFYGARANYTLRL